MPTCSAIHNHKILILDFGSQFTQLIARRVREAGVYCEIYACDVAPEHISQFNPRGIILSGGPESVTVETRHAIPDDCLLYTSPSPRDQRGSRMPSSA